jgi:PAS domain S-box-containing protein
VTATDFQGLAKLGDLLGPQSAGESAMRILLAEDNADHRELMRLALAGHDATWQVEGVVSGEEALRHLAEGEAYDVVFLDYSLPRRDGLEVLAEIRRGEAPPPVVMVTGRGDEQVAVEAMKGGAYDYIVKGEGYLQRLPVVAQRAVEAHQLAVERKRAEEALRESEAQLRELYDEAPVGYHELDGEGRLRRVNRTELAMLGYTAEEMVGRPVWEFVLEREAAHRAVLATLAGSNLVPAFERTYLRKDGTRVPVLIEDRLLRDAEGRITGIRSTIQDISARKQAEEAVRENQEVLEAVLETTRALIVLTDSDGRILLFNRACEELAGYSRQEVLGKPIAECFRDQAWASIALKLLMDRGAPGLLAPHEGPWQTASGERRLIEWRFRVFPSPRDGRPCVLGTGVDITARKRAEEALRESEERYRSFVQNFQGIAFRGTMDFTPIFFHGAVKAITGYTEAEFLAGNPRWDQVIHPDDLPQLQVVEKLRSTPGYSVERDYRILRKDGQICWVHELIRNVCDSSGKPFVIEGALYDISERKQIEEALRVSEEKFFKSFRSSPDSIAISALADGRLIEVNDSFVRVTGYSREEAVGRTTIELNLWANPKDRARLVRMLRDQGTARNLEVGLRMKSGEVRVGEISGEIIELDGAPYVLMITRDITERRRAEEALLARTLQLEAVRAVTAEISRELDLAALLELINRRAGELVGATSGTVRLWDEQAELLIPVAWHGLGEWMKDQCRRLGEGLSGTVAQRREGMIVNDYRRSPYAHPATLERTKIAAVLAEPLIYRDRLLGVLTVDNHEPRRRFTEQDQELFRIFAAQAAIAIENARLHTAAVRRGAELESLLRTASTVLSGLDLRGTLDRILMEAAQIAGTSYVKVLLLDRKTQILWLEAALGFPPEIIKGFQIPLGTGLSGIVAATGQPLVVQDCQNDPRNTAADRDRHLGLVTYLGLPIKSQDQVLGVLTFNLTYPHQYTQDELAYLGAFADQVAIAIENARLFEQVRAGRERLQALSHRLVEVQEIERRGIARELHDEIGQLLTGLKLVLEMSTGVKADTLKARLAEAQALVNELMARVRDLSLNLRPAMLDDLGLLPALLWHFERYTAQANVRVDFQHSGLEGRLTPGIETAAYRIVQEALNNVARHAGVTEATVRLWVDQDTLNVQIQDQGAGFDPDATLAATTSIGLVGMRERAALLGGSLTVESAPGAGTRVTAELPLRKTGNVKSET